MTGAAEAWRKSSQLRKVLLACLALIIFGSAAQSQDKGNATTTKAERVHIAFSGGGWRAHSGHTGWISSVLKDAKTIRNALENVDTISSNSGGSWFSTMLLYSSRFQKELNDGNNLAWISDQAKKYQKNLCDKTQVKYFGKATDCIILEYDLNWRRFISEFVVDSSWIEPTRTLDKPEPWASQKSLLIAATLLTRDVVLDSGFNGLEPYKNFHWLCPNLSTPVLTSGWIGHNDGHKGGFCSPPLSHVLDVVPVTFASGELDNFLKHNYKLAYSKNFFRDAPLSINLIKKPLVSSGVKVINAAAASSAAAGYAASKHVSGYWERAHVESDLAVSFSLAGGKVKQFPIPALYPQYPLTCLLAA